MSKSQLPYVVHTTGQSVLLPEGEVLEYPAHGDGVCVPCTLRYRQSHRLGLETGDLARLLNPPDDAEQLLEQVEARAMELQRLNPLGGPAERTACLEVDSRRADPLHLFGRVTILVANLYDRVFEEQLFYGHLAWVKRRLKRGQAGVLRYWLYFEGQQLPLDSREQALQAIRRRGLPDGIALPGPPPLMTADDVDALFDDVVKKGGADSKTVRR